MSRELLDQIRSNKTEWIADLNVLHTTHYQPTECVNTIISSVGSASSAADSFRRWAAAVVLWVDYLSLGAEACEVVMLAVSIIQSFLSFLVMVSFSSESFNGMFTVRWLFMILFIFNCFSHMLCATCMKSCCKVVYLVKTFYYARDPWVQ